MSRLIVPEDCGNSPRKRFLRDWYQALANNDLTELENQLNTDCQLCMAGGKSFKGRLSILTYFQTDPLHHAIEIRIETIITHGRDASVNGVYETKNGVVHFSDVFRFKSASGFDVSEIKRHLVR